MPLSQCLCSFKSKSHIWAVQAVMKYLWHTHHSGSQKVTVQWLCISCEWDECLQAHTDSPSLAKKPMTLSLEPNSKTESSSQNLAYHLKYFTPEYSVTMLCKVSSKSLMLTANSLGPRGPCAAPPWKRLTCPDIGTEYEGRNLSVSSLCHCSFHYTSWWLLQE